MDKMSNSYKVMCLMGCNCFQLEVELCFGVQNQFKCNSILYDCIHTEDVYTSILIVESVRLI